MQEQYPKLEDELERALIGMISNATNAFAPLTAELQSHRLFEGGRSALVREDGEFDETYMKTFSAESTIPFETILYGSLQDMINCFRPVAEAMASDREKMFFEVVDESTKKVGNVVDGKGKPLTYELLLEVFEKIHINFDSNGVPQMPTMVISPQMADRVQQLMNDPSAPEYKKKLDDIIARKKVEWRAREADRILAG